MKQTDKTTKKNTEKNARKPGKCSYIDSLLLKGNYTLREIADMAHKKFGGNAKSTLHTVNARPFHMRAKGLKPVWMEAPKEKAPAKK